MAKIPPTTVVLLTALFLTVFKEAEAEAAVKGLSRPRQKREWIIAPKKLKENHNYGNQIIAKIRSDEEMKVRVTYSLEGEGADIGLFVVEPGTGFVRVTGILDREQKSEYHLKGIAKFLNGTKAEKDIDLHIYVEDENDCTPEFLQIPVGQVNESSAKGTFVMMVNATDRDDQATENAKISYRITGQNPGGELMFSVDRETGAIQVNLPTLDREVQDKYTLILEAKDLNGRMHGNSASANITINILDINDNIPTMENSVYYGTIEENLANVVVMRIKVQDKDLVGSDNWLVVFTIESGNEAGYFTITTDSKTNEGVVFLNKALDYEEVKEVELVVSVSNKAEYHITSNFVQKIFYTIKIKVQNQPEGPIFKPRVKVVIVTEGIKTLLHQVIVTYPAVDGDTFEILRNVRYLKGKDPDNWLIINENTAEVTLTKLPDRESKYLINGTYYAEIICITKDIPSYTATGTIAITVQDSNDHCPELVQTPQTVCKDKNFIYLTGHDEDSAPNGAPFEFTVASKTQMWRVEHINDTTALLRANKPLWPGLYQLEIDIRDQQGKMCEKSQLVKFQVCTCNNSGTCSWSEKPRAVFGAPGVGLLFLGLLLLLLVPLLLLLCACGGTALGLPTFVEIPFEPIAPLSSGNTEEKGEDKPLTKLLIPTDKPDGYISKENIGITGSAVPGLGYGNGYEGNNGHSMWYDDQFVGKDSRWRYHTVTGGNVANESTMFSKKHFYRMAKEDCFSRFALPEAFLEMYYSKKADCVTEESHEKDASLHFHEEGSGSPRGSVGCCSFINVDNNLEFLNDLDPKFKTLAEVCSGSVLETARSSSVSGTVASKLADQTSTTPSLIHTGITEFEASQSSMSRPTHSVTTTLVEEHQNMGVVHPTPVHQATEVSRQTYILQPQPLIMMEPRVHPTMFVSEMPNMYVLSNTLPPVAHGTLSHTEKVLLVENVAAESSHSIQQDRDVSGLQNILMVERQARPGMGINGGLLIKETQSAGGLSSSVDIFSEESQQVHRESHLTTGVRKGEAFKSQNTVSMESSSHRDVLGSHSRHLQGEVLVHEKKVSITEQSLQGNVTG